jgi:colanic acid/amylovoran biosynthesis glycosyltransferase
MKMHRSESQPQDLRRSVPPPPLRVARTVTRAARGSAATLVADEVRVHPAVTAVGYVIDRFPSGFHPFVLPEILALESCGIDVHVFSLASPEGCLYDNAVALARLKTRASYFLADTDASGDAPPSGAGMTLPAARWIARHVTARGIGHLHAHGATVATDVVREAGRLTGRGYSFTAHARDLHDVNAPSIREKMLEAQFAVALSEFDFRRLSGMCGRGFEGKLHRIPMSVEAQDYEPFERQHLGNSILTVGALVEPSGLVDLVEAMGILRRCGVVSRATILGDGEFVPALRDRIERLGLTSQMAIVSMASRRHLAALIQSHTVMVLPWSSAHGDRDALAILILEAMAGGLPVLCSDGPSVRELINDGLTGRVFSAGDPAGLAGALDTLFGSARLRESLAARARGTVEEQFAAGRNASQLARLFAGAIAGQSLTA